MPVTSTDAYDDLRLVEKQIGILQQLKLSPDISAAISITCNCVNEFREALLSDEKMTTLAQEEGATNTSNKLSQ